MQGTCTCSVYHEEIYIEQVGVGQQADGDTSLLTAPQVAKSLLHPLNDKDLAIYKHYEPLQFTLLKEFQITRNE